MENVFVIAIIFHNIYIYSIVTDSQTYRLTDVEATNRVPFLSFGTKLLKTINTVAYNFKHPIKLNTYVSNTFKVPVSY